VTRGSNLGSQTFPRSSYVPWFGWFQFVLGLLEDDTTARMSSKVTMTEPKPLPSPPPSPSPSPTPIEQYTNNSYLTPGSPTANKGKGRMMDASTDSQQSDQDDDSDGYPTDETETKRVEEVGGHLCFWSHRLSAFFQSVRKYSVDSSQMGDGRTRTKAGGPGIRVILQVFGAGGHQDRESDLGGTAQSTTSVGGSWGPPCHTRQRERGRGAPRGSRSHSTTLRRQHSDYEPEV